MAYMVTMLNEGGILDQELARNTKEAATLAIRMIRDAGELHAGDRIAITMIDNGQEEIWRARRRHHT